MRRLRRHRLGTWLGVLAVVFYAWLPGHFAGHVALAALEAHGALDGDQGTTAYPHRLHHPAGHHTHPGGTCPICAAAAASTAPAAAMLPVLAVLPAPRSTAAPPGIAEAQASLTATSLAPYAPRGPPSAT